MDLQQELAGGKKSKKTKLIAVIAAVLIVAGLILLPLLTKADSGEDEVIRREYPVSKGDIVTGIEGKGNITADGTSHNFKDVVTLEELFVNTGDEVKAGDPLAKLSIEAIDEELKTLNEQLQKMNIALSGAQNNKDQANKKISDTSAAKQENNSQKAAVGNEIAAINQEIASLSSQIKSLNDQIASIEDIPENADQLKVLRDELAAKETALAERETLLAEKQQAYASLEAAGSAIGNPDTDMTSYDNAIKLAQLDVKDVADKIKKLKDLKSDPYLYAEVDGIVTETNGALNSKTSLETPVAKIAAIKDLYAKIMIPQSDIADVQVGQRVEFTLDAYPGLKFTGTVRSRELVAQQSGSTITYGVIIDIDSVDEELINGMTLAAKLITKELKDVVQVSNKAITLRDGKQYVTLMDENGAFYEQEVVTGFSDGRVSEVLSGLKEGDIAYVEG